MKAVRDLAQPSWTVGQTEGPHHCRGCQHRQAMRLVRPEFQGHLERIPLAISELVVVRVVLHGSRWRAEEILERCEPALVQPGFPPMRDCFLRPILESDP